MLNLPLPIIPMYKEDMLTLDCSTPETTVAPSPLRLAVALTERIASPPASPQPVDHLDCDDGGHAICKEVA